MLFSKKNFAFLFLALVTLSFALPQTGTFRDARDGHVYKTVVIGTRVWMAENMVYNVEGSSCYDNKPENCAKYGRLYTFEAAKKVCPSGWHLPENDEWKRFRTIIEDSDGKEAAWVSLKSRDKWDGSDRYGFDVVPAGKATDEFVESAVLKIIDFSVVIAYAKRRLEAKLICLTFFAYAKRMPEANFVCRPNVIYILRGIGSGRWLQTCRYHRKFSHTNVTCGD